MTQIAYPLLFDSVIEYDENHIPFIVVENRKEYRNLLVDIKKQKEGLDGELLISNDLKNISFKNIDIINDYSNDNLNTKTLLSKLSTLIEMELNNEKYVEDLININSVLQCILFEIIGELPYEIEVNDSLIIKDLVKQFNPHFCGVDTDDLKDALLKYMMASRDLLGTKLFILRDLKLSFSSSEVEEIYKCFFYEKLNVVVLQSEKVYSNSNEILVTVDDDLCVIC